MRAATFACLTVSLLASPSAQAQEYPAKAVRIITSTPGNFHDIVARRVAQSLTERWKQPVIVENRGGAGAIIAATAVAQAPADGYTLLVTDRTAMAVQPSLNSHLGYDPVKDLAPITLLGAAPLLLVAHPSVAAGTLPEFIAHLRAAPDSVPFASAGPGTGPHLLAEVLKQSTGANLVSVQYKGSPAAMMGLLGGETKAAFMLVPVGLPHVRAGKVKVFATTGKARFPGAPDIPCVAEVGMKDLESELWLALMAPARTPKPIIAKVHRDVVEILSDPAIKATLNAQGADIAHSTPAELSAFMLSETAKWKKVIALAGVKPD